MTTVAFLQNIWVRDVSRVRALYEDYPDQRESITARLLFMGGLTGKRLAKVFEEAVDDIVWEEISKEIGGQSSSVFPPDFDHIRSVISKHNPEIVLTFGRVAKDALIRLCRSDNYVFKLFCGPHPAARHASVMDELQEVANARVMAMELVVSASAQKRGG